MRAGRAITARSGDMKRHEARRDIMREWMALPAGKRQTQEQTQCIVNAFFFSVTIFAVAFAFFVLSARAQDHHHHPPIHSLLVSGVGV
jgi:hypothetical protein